jgi:hypothetical protein
MCTTITETVALAGSAKGPHEAVDQGGGVHRVAEDLAPIA